MNSVLKNDVPDKVFFFFFLATKAGKTFSGEFSVEKAVKETAKQTAAELCSISPEGDTGEYAKHWSYKRDKNLSGRHRYDMVVYSKKPEYRITHLLEKGHAKRNGGRVDGIPHIKIAEKHAKEILQERIERYL